MCLANAESIPEEEGCAYRPDRACEDCHGGSSAQLPHRSRQTSAHSSGFRPRGLPARALPVKRCSILAFLTPSMTSCVLEALYQSFTKNCIIWLQNQRSWSEQRWAKIPSGQPLLHCWQGQPTDPRACQRHRRISDVHRSGR